jgi:hypothetical protein
MKSNDVVWALQAFHPRKNEDLWSSWQRVNGMSRISQAGELQGISDIGSGRLLVIKPYGFWASNLPQSVAGTGLTPGWSGLYTGGVDAKIGLRSNLLRTLPSTPTSLTLTLTCKTSTHTLSAVLPRTAPVLPRETPASSTFPRRHWRPAVLQPPVGTILSPVRKSRQCRRQGHRLDRQVCSRRDGGQHRESGPNPGANYVVGRVKPHFGAGRISASWASTRPRAVRLTVTTKP